MSQTGLYPLISIITPVYNGASYLEELIHSVQSQDYPHIEHIIIDDGSNDEGATLGILKRFPHVRWWSRKNKGQYATMNEGLLAAKGDILCFVSADDVISPGAVSRVVSYFKKYPYSDGVFGLTARIDSLGKPIPYYIPFRTAPISLYPYFAHISHCSLYVKGKSLLDRALLFNPSLRYVGDYDWMIRIYKEGLRMGLLRQELSKVRLHVDQTSKKYQDDSILETESVIAAHRINRLLYGIFNTIYRFLFKIWYVCQAIKNEGTTAVFKRLVTR